MPAVSFGEASPPLLQVLALGSQGWPAICIGTLQTIKTLCRANSIQRHKQQKGTTRIGGRPCPYTPVAVMATQQSISYRRVGPQTQQTRSMALRMSESPGRQRVIRISRRTGNEATSRILSVILVVGSLVSGATVESLQPRMLSARRDRGRHWRGWCDALGVSG